MDKNPYIDKQSEADYNYCMAKRGIKLFNGKPIEVVLSALRQAYAIGCPDCEAASLAGISGPALCRYLSEHPDFVEEKERLLQKQFVTARNSILKCISEGDGDLALRFMERKKKKEFSTLSQIEIGEQGSYRELSDAELAQIAAGKKTPADFLGLEKKP